jgi:outer membrane protein assembly complex, YaeT protein
MIWRALLLAAGLAGAAAAENGENGRVEFEGNESYSSAHLLNVLERRYYVSLRGDFGVTDADDAAYFLRTFYFSQGFRDASVRYDYHGTQPPSVLFQIDEGNQKYIRNVTFEGESALAAQRMRDIFDAAVRQATLRPFGRMRYVATAVDAGAAAISAALAHRGYLLAETHVEDSAIEGRFVDLRVEVRQGIQYFVRDVTFENAPVSEEELRGVLKDYLDQPYRRNEEQLMRTRLEDWLRNRGYLDAEVAVDTDLDVEGGVVRMDFDIEAGRTYTIGEIRVEGAERTHEREILSRFAVRSGSLYDASKIDEAARRLWFSGAFSEADVKRIPNSDGTVDLVLSLQETSAKRLRFGAGYSQWDMGFLQAHYVDRNFFGTLNRFNIDTYVSQRSYGVNGAITDPWLWGSDFEGAIGGFFARRELPAYRSLEYGGTLSLTRRYSERNLTGYRIQYGWKRVTDSVIFGSSESGQDDPDYTLGNLTFRQTYDTRNDILSPMKGLYAHHEEEIASPVLLGDVSFVRFEAQFTYYQPLRELTTERPFVPFLVFNHAAGVLFPYGSTNVVPVQERFFLGGPNTVRSFQLDGLGPKDSDGDPVGGRAMVLFNLELQWPVFDNIYVAAFADAGNIWSAASDIQPTDLKVGVGPGLRLYTPLGAVRVDYGYNVNRQQGDPIGAWQVGFGFTF